MKTIEIIGSNFAGMTANTRIACRGILLREGKVLLSHERNTGWYLIPGGGLEAGETIGECCAREVLEETGFLVDPQECFLTLKEYYEDWCYISHYFRCSLTGQDKQNLTTLEQARGLVPEWVDLREAVAIFADHVNLTHHEEKRGSYQREHQAIQIFLETYM